MSSVTEGAGHVAARRDGVRPKAVVASAPAASRKWSRTASTGLLVPPRDASALERRRSSGVLRDQALAGASAAAGRARVELRFTADRMVQETLDVYERLRA